MAKLLPKSLKDPSPSGNSKRRNGEGEAGTSARDMSPGQTCAGKIVNGALGSEEGVPQSAGVPALLFLGTLCVHSLSSLQVSVGMTCVCAACMCPTHSCSH